MVIDGPVGMREPAGHLRASLHRRAAAHELPIVVTGPAEEQLGREAPKGFDEAAHATLDPDLPAVVVTGSIAEMIGGGVTPEGTGIRGASCRARSTRTSGAPTRDALAVVRARLNKGACAHAATERAARVNIIGPGMVSPAHDLAEIRRLVAQGIGAEGEPGLPLAATCWTCRAWSTDVNICMYREYGQLLLRGARAPVSAGADRAAQHRFLRAWALLQGSTGRSSSARSSTMKPVWDLWRSVTRTSSAPPSLTWCRRTYSPRACGISSRMNSAYRLPFAVVQSRPRPTTRRVPAGEGQDAAGDVRQLQRAHVPGRGGGGSMPKTVHSGVSPLPIIRRHTGTLSWAMPAPRTWVQEFCSSLFDALFHILPLGTDLDRGPDAGSDAGDRPGIGTPGSVAGRVASSQAEPAGAGTRYQRPSGCVIAPNATPARRRTTCHGAAGREIDAFAPGEPAWTGQSRQTHEPVRSPDA